MLVERCKADKTSSGISACINISQALEIGGDGPIIVFAFVRYHPDYGDQLWVPSLDKGKVRSGVPEDYWSGTNRVPVTELLPKLWLVNWPVPVIRQLEKAQKNGRAGGILVSYRQMP